MDKKIYRKKNVDKLSSPEELNDYIKVTNPGVRVILGAIIVLLIGVCVWGYFGKLETKITVLAKSNESQTTLYVKESNIEKVKVEQNVYINKETYKISSISSEPFSISEGKFSDYELHIGELSVGEWVYEVNINTTLTSGTYSAQIVVDSVSPYYFIFN